MEDRRYGTYMNFDHNKCFKKCCNEAAAKRCRCEEEKVCPCKEEKCTPRMSPNCRGCICQQLRRLEAPVTLDIFLNGGQSFLGVTFISFDPQNCCAVFLEPGTTGTLTIDCNQIDAIRRVA